MEFLFFTRREWLRRRLSSLTDKLFRGRNARYMSVNSEVFSSRDSVAAAGKYVSALIIFDVDSFDDWESIVTELEKLGKGIKICLISRAAKGAVRAINSFSSFVCGYVLEECLNEMYEKFINSLFGRIRTVCGGIAVTHYSSVDKVIPFGEIYYIETVKRTHMCRVVHSRGSDEIRADISKLIGELDQRFLIARSSTIINLSAVVGTDGTRVLFPDGKSCICTEKYAHSLIPAMQRAVLI